MTPAPDSQPAPRVPRRRKLVPRILNLALEISRAEREGDLAACETLCHQLSAHASDMARACTPPRRKDH